MSNKAPWFWPRTARRKADKARAVSDMGFSWGRRVTQRRRRLAERRREPEQCWEEEQAPQNGCQGTRGGSAVVQAPAGGERGNRHDDGEQRKICGKDPS